MTVVRLLVTERGGPSVGRARRPDMYGAGHNEVLVGRTISGRRDEVQLATKLGIDRSGGDDKRVVRCERSYVKRERESSLLRLGVNLTDLYYLHRPPQTAEIEETVGAMAELAVLDPLGDQVVGARYSAAPGRSITTASHRPPAKGDARRGRPSARWQCR